MKNILMLLVVGFAFAGCSGVKPVGEKDLIVVSGKLSALGMSTFQYGTHILKDDSKTYALRSSKVDLKAFEGKDVIVKGLKVSGYPVDGGPEFLDVQEISNK